MAARERARRTAGRRSIPGEMVRGNEIALQPVGIAQSDSQGAPSTNEEKAPGGQPPYISVAGNRTHSFGEHSPHIVVSEQPTVRNIRSSDPHPDGQAANFRLADLTSKTGQSAVCSDIDNGQSVSPVRNGRLRQLSGPRHYEDLATCVG
jgi:hypothetical protein